MGRDDCPLREGGGGGFPGAGGGGPAAGAGPAGAGPASPPVPEVALPGLAASTGCGATSSISL